MDELERKCSCLTFDCHRIDIADFGFCWFAFSVSPFYQVAAALCPLPPSGNSFLSSPGNSLTNLALSLLSMYKSDCSPANIPPLASSTANVSQMLGVSPNHVQMTSIRRVFGFYFVILDMWNFIQLHSFIFEIACKLWAKREQSHNWRQFLLYSWKVCKIVGGLKRVCSWPQYRAADAKCG